MKKVRLYGELGKKFNSSWELNVSTVQEALSAIEANSSGFFEHTIREHVKGNKYIILLKDPLEVESENDAIDSLITKNNLNSDIKSEEIHILPVPKGGAVGSTAIGMFWASAVGGAGALATVLTVATYVAIAVAISFITQALFKPPAPPKPGTKVSSKSLLLAGQKNRQAQGIPVPLGYGLLKIGSANIDAKIDTFNLRRNSKSTSTVLESYSTTEYIDLLCEGPIAGLADKNGNLLTTNDIREGIYLNNVQIKNTVSSGEIASFNYVLNEERELPKLKKGLSSETIALSNDVSYTIQYGTQLYGPGPYVGGTARSVYNNFESAIRKGAFIFSHAITDRNVSKIKIQFAAQMMQMNKDPGDTLSDSIRFVIFYTKNGKRINIFDPDSDISPDDIHYLEGQSNSSEVNGNKITKGLQKIKVGDDYFFMIQGLATSFYEFSVSIKYDPDVIFIDNSEQLNFSVVKLTAEFDQSVDSSGSVSYDNPNGNNNTYLGHIGGIMRQKSIKIPYVQESIEAKVIYPHSAAIKIKFDSKNFNNIPLRSYHVKMKKILVPSNYEPESRTYNGPWNGLFAGQQAGESSFSVPDEKRVWTNNPAWVFYDLLTNYRYGLGKYGVEDLMIDKWQLYKIGKYCDELVETNYPIETTNRLPLAFTTQNILDSNSLENGLRRYKIPPGAFFIKIKSDQFRYPNKSNNESGDFIPFLYTEEDFIKDFGDNNQFKGKKIAFFIHKHNYTDNQISSSTDVQAALAKDSVVRKGEYDIEERFIVGSKITNGEMLVLVTGPTFSENSSTYKNEDGNITIGACATQLNHSIVEPRFESNLYLTEQSEAINALNSLASLFRGMVTYTAGKISVVQDSQKTPIMLFNNSNVRKKEGFSYSGFAKNKKVTASLVRFNNKERNYKPDVVYEEDNAAMQVYGYVEKETMGMGITSRSMARRLAKWVLASSNLESEKIQFVTGSEGSFLFPGSLFEVSDENRSGDSTSGRILNLFFKDKYTDNQGQVQEKDKLSILIDKDLNNLPSIRNVEIVINVGLDNEKYETINQRAQQEKSEEDQDVDIDSIYSPQILRFEGRVFVDEELEEKGPQGQKTLITDLDLRMSFGLDLGTNTIKIYKHGLKDGDRVRFSSLGLLPSGLNIDKRGQSAYFVINSTRNTFKVSEQENGSEVNIIDNGKDYFLNEGGEHFVCVESVGQSISPVTLLAFKQLEIGTPFSLNGLFGTSGSSGQDSSNVGVLNNIFVDEPGNPKKDQWYESRLFGTLQHGGSDWFYAISFGWIYLGQLTKQVNTGEQGFWFWLTNVGWAWSNYDISEVSQAPNKRVGWWYLDLRDKSMWAAVIYEENDPDPVRLYVYDNVDGYSVGQSYQLGDRKFDIIDVSEKYIGLKLTSKDNSTTIPDEIPQELSGNSYSSLNPGYNEREIFSIEKKSENLSVQNKNSVIIKLDDGHGADLFKNRNINIKNFNSSDGGLNSIMNKKWNTIYVDSNTIELIDSDEAYNLIDSASIEDKGEMFFTEDINIKTSRIFQTQLFRTLGVKELDNNQFEVQGIEYSPAKFDMVDKDASVQLPLMPIPPQANMSLPEAPEDLILTDLSV